MQLILPLLAFQKMYCLRTPWLLALQGNEVYRRVWFQVDTVIREKAEVRKLCWLPDLSNIRPFVYVREQALREFAETKKLPVIPGRLTLQNFLSMKQETLKIKSFVK